MAVFDFIFSFQETSVVYNSFHASPCLNIIRKNFRKSHADKPYSGIQISSAKIKAAGKNREEAEKLLFKY